MPNEFVNGGPVFPAKTAAGVDITRSADTYDSDPVVMSDGKGITLAVQTDVDVTVSLLPEIDGVFRGPSGATLAAAASTPSVITFWPLKLARVKVRVVVGSDTIFGVDAHVVG